MSAIVKQSVRAPQANSKAKSVSAADFLAGALRGASATTWSTSEKSAARTPRAGWT
jgi:hypothetical protein